MNTEEITETIEEIPKINLDEDEDILDKSIQSGKPKKERTEKQKLAFEKARKTRAENVLKRAEEKKNNSKPVGRPKKAKEPIDTGLKIPNPSAEEPIQEPIKEPIEEPIIELSSEEEQEIIYKKKPKAKKVVKKKKKPVKKVIYVSDDSSSESESESESESDEEVIVKQITKKKKSKNKVYYQDEPQIVDYYNNNNYQYKVPSITDFYKVM